MLTTIGDLFTALENGGFETADGSLKNRIEFLIIKDLLFEVLLDRIPSHYVEQYNLFNGHVPEDSALYFNE